MAELTDGQLEALDELALIAADKDFGVEVIDKYEPENEFGSLFVDVSIDCSNIEVKDNGIKLRNRERFVWLFDQSYPLTPPSVIARNREFAFKDHAYWIDRFGISLCIYYSPDHQWLPEDGLFGFLIQLSQWLSDAARGKLNAVNEPIHPPISSGRRAEEFYVIKDDCPKFDVIWDGYARVKPVNSKRLELVGWHKEWIAMEEDWLVPSILIDGGFVSEAPDSVASLLGFLIKIVKIDPSALAALLLLPARRGKSQHTPFFVLGVAMRGTVGKERRQHLMIWKFGEKDVAQLRKLAKPDKKNITKNVAEKMVEKGSHLVETWTDSKNALSPCLVYDMRPEVTSRRDETAKSAWLYAKTVTLWGAGALGSVAAEFIVRAGVGEIRVLDNGFVNPGILVRQNYLDKDIGRKKVDALARRLREINPHVVVKSEHANILTEPGIADVSLVNSDILIDATASRRVALSIDKRLGAGSGLSLPIATIGNDSKAECGIVTVTKSNSRLGPTDLLIRTALSLHQKSEKEWLKKFWMKTDEAKWFEPEPGCSSPTFRGGAAGTAALAGRMLEMACEMLSADSGGQAALICNSNDLTEHHLKFTDDNIDVCARTGYEIRTRAAVQEKILAITEKEQRNQSPVLETGGVLFGYRDDYLKTVWVVDAIGPPKDSVATDSEFVCGILGVRNAVEEWQMRTDNSVGFIGTWHSHPTAGASPSVVDLDAMNKLLEQSGSWRHRLLLSIVGYSAKTPTIASYLFGGEGDI